MILAALLTLAATTGVVAQAPGVDPRPPALSLEEIVRTRTPGHFAVSRDGRRVVHALSGFHFGFPVVPRFGEDNNLRVIDAETGESVQATTGLSPKTAPRFSPDGTRVLFESEGDLFVVELAGGATRRLTTHPSRDHDAEWSPDGRSIVFVSDRAGRTDLWIMSASGEREALRRLTDDSASESDPEFAPDGASITFSATRPDEHYFSSGLYSVPAGGGAPSRLTPRDDRDNHTLRHSPDGTRIAYISDRTGFARVVLANPDGSNPQTVDTPPGDCASPHWRVAPQFSADGKRILVSLGREGRFDLVEIDVASARARVLREADGHHHALGYRSDGAPLYVHENYFSPPDLVVLAAAGSRRLTHSGHARYQPAAFAERRRVTFPSADGFVVHATLLTPRGPQAGPLPAVVNLHPNSYGQFFDHWSPYFDYLATSGYAVLNVDQRGSSGYGRAYRDAAIGQWGTGTYEDVKAAARWLGARPDVDRSRIGVMGLSFGGYLTLMGLVRDPDLFAAGIDLMGVVDRRGRFAGRNTLFHVGPTEAENPDLWARISPITQIAKLRAPLLILHADEDRNVSVEQTHILVDELVRHGKNHEVRIYQGEAHGLADPQNQLDSYQRILAFFDRHLRGPAGALKEE